MGPIREIPPNKIMTIKGESSLRKIKLNDFRKALHAIKPSVSKASLLEYAMWHKATASI
jgi:SpoVK/Ycf46/Vps4 family AAA+-type ATPase